MANYVFETLTPEQAAVFTATDTVAFSTPGATARAVAVTLVPYVAPNFFLGLVGSTPSVTLSFGGKTLVFDGAGSTARSAAPPAPPSA